MTARAVYYSWTSDGEIPVVEDPTTKPPSRMIAICVVGASEPGRRLTSGLLALDDAPLPLD